jgi:hypothetical protein
MRRIVGAFATALCAASPAAAQTEIGVDMVLQLTNYASSENTADLGNVTSFNFPAGHVRVGVFVTPEVSLEPRLGFNHASTGGESISSTEMMVSGYYHFPAISRSRSAFVRLGTGATIVSGGSYNDTQMLLDTGVGLKLPTRDNLLFRLEAFIGRSFESDAAPAATRLGASFGVSWRSDG